MLDCLQEPPPYLADNEFEGHEIIPSLFLGDYSSASKRDALKERKVTHIINCARIARKWFPEVATRLFSSASIFCRNELIERHCCVAVRLVFPGLHVPPPGDRRPPYGRHTGPSRPLLRHHQRGPTRWRGRSRALVRTQTHSTATKVVAGQ